jgi:DNA-binding transcriptional ArsR family regulator
MKFILNGTAEILMQPARFKILQFLRDNGPAFVEKIAKGTGVHPRMVSHHLDVLQDEKLVESRYELAKVEGSKRGVAVRTCWTTKRAEEALEDVRVSLKERTS